MEHLILGLSIEQWMEIGISVLIVLGAVILGHWLVKVVSNQLVRRLARRTKTSLDDTLLEVLRLPLYLLLIVLAFDAALSRLDFLPPSWDTWMGDLFYLLYLLVGFVFAGRFVYNFFIWYGDEMAERTKTDLDEQLMPFFRRVAMIILWLIGIIMVLSHFDVDVSAMVTTLGIGSLAIALAAQESLADTISGFIIMIDRPFRIGDRIEIQDLNTWGDVVDIGLRSSKIRTRDNRMVVIPNSIIAKSLVVNHAYPDTQYRIQIHIGLAYGTDIEHAREVMIKAVQGVDGVLADHPVDALFLEFGDSALIFRVRWWIESYVDTRVMFDRVNTAIYKALNNAGVNIPYPHMEVFHNFKPGDLQKFTDNRKES